VVEYQSWQARAKKRDRPVAKLTQEQPDRCLIQANGGHGFIIADGCPITRQQYRI